MACFLLSATQNPTNYNPKFCANQPKSKKAPKIKIAAFFVSLSVKIYR